jgi:hypothetical protein
VGGRRDLGALSLRIQWDDSDAFDKLISTTVIPNVEICGHGARGEISVNFESYGGAEEIADDAKKRKRNGLPKLKMHLVNECCVMQDGAMLNACLDLADQVQGFEGWTIALWSLSPGIQHLYGQKDRRSRNTADSSTNYYWGPGQVSKHAKALKKGLKAKEEKTR